MKHAISLFIGTFTTLLAIINPIEAIPVFLGLTEGKDDGLRVEVARKSCFYGALLLFFFLLFGNFVLWIFAIPLSVVRVVGGIILMRLGFELFSPSASGGMIPNVGKGGITSAAQVAFVPLAMPIMVGPGAIATVLGMSSLIKQPEHWSIILIIFAIIATMFLTYLSLIYAKKIQLVIGPQGIDACTRIIGFFVAAMGMGLIFHGVAEAIHDYNIFK